VRHRWPPLRRHAPSMQAAVVHPFLRRSGDPPCVLEHVARVALPPQRGEPPVPLLYLGRCTWLGIGGCSLRARPGCKRHRNSSDRADSCRSSQKVRDTARIAGRTERDCRCEIAVPPACRADENSTPPAIRATIGTRQGGATRWTARLYSGSSVSSAHVSFLWSESATKFSAGSSAQHGAAADSGAKQKATSRTTTRIT